MARYIDADIVHEKIDAVQTSLESNDDRVWRKNKPYYKGLAMARAVIYEQPAADVAPRSEVVKTLNEVELLIIITKETYKQQMEDAPNELSKQSKRTKWVAFEKFYEQFAELKKKYTGEGDKHDD